MEPTMGPVHPRIIVAGLSGDAGKTLVSLGLALMARERGLPVRGFKKGPDYIDAAWLGWATGEPARNLDTFLMGVDGARGQFLRHALPDDLNLIEGNRGLYDGVDAEGSHSTAALARSLRAPVLLVVDGTKVTRTVAACVYGCQKLDPDLWIAGVVINRVSGARHEGVVRDAIESVCRLPVLGVLPKTHGGGLVPARHLGLVPPEEFGDCAALGRRVREFVASRLAFDQIVAIARGALTVDAVRGRPPDGVEGRGLRIGYLRDAAFTFYYPENLEAIEASGACLVPLSALADTALPEDLDALYIGGGFPETHAWPLAANRTFLASVRSRADSGLPIYAECGGLMLLSRGIAWRGDFWPMAGVLPFAVQVCAEPQGHGYTELSVDRENPFFATGSVLRGHEFHYSRIVPDGEVPPTVCRMRRGTGSCDGRDGIVAGNVWASYTHLHAVSAPAWERGLLGAAREHASSRGADGAAISRRLGERGGAGPAPASS
jgi:cobyrinic acid a,c-diamide synthase